MVICTSSVHAQMLLLSSSMDAVIVTRAWMSHFPSKIHAGVFLFAKLTLRNGAIWRMPQRECTAVRFLKRNTYFETKILLTSQFWTVYEKKTFTPNYYFSNVYLASLISDCCHSKLLRYQQELFLTWNWPATLESGAMKIKEHLPLSGSQAGFKQDQWGASRARYIRWDTSQSLLFPVRPQSREHQFKSPLNHDYRKADVACSAAAHLCRG